MKKQGIKIKRIVRKCLAIQNRITPTIIHMEREEKSQRREDVRVKSGIHQEELGVALGIKKNLMDRHGDLATIKSYSMLDT